MLRVAYIEALYRLDEFQFEKLNQNFWFNLIRELTTPIDGVILKNTGKINKGFTTVHDAINKYFPIEAETSAFSRSAVLGYTGLNTVGKPLHSVCPQVHGYHREGPCKRFPVESC